MTTTLKQDEIIEMARQAGMAYEDDTDRYIANIDDLQDFAKLVAEAAVSKEREACAVIAEEWFCGCGRGNCPEVDRRAHDIADSIRARDEA
jgi:hypothetical protein